MPNLVVWMMVGCIGVRVESKLTTVRAMFNVAVSFLKRLVARWVCDELGGIWIFVVGIDAPVVAASPCQFWFGVGLHCALDRADRPDDLASNTISMFEKGPFTWRLSGLDE